MAFIDYSFRKSFKFSVTSHNNVFYSDSQEKVLNQIIQKLHMRWIRIEE